VSESGTIWAFGPDGWQKVPDTIFTSDEDCDHLLKDAGYAHATCLGLNISPLGVDVFESEHPREDFVLIVQTPGRWYPVVVRDLPSLLKLLGDLLPVVTQAMACDKAEEKREAELRERRRRHA
jgi:hypothetical protein